MAKNLTIAERNFAVGTFTREIDTIPATSNGFELRMARDAVGGIESKAETTLADLQIDISLDDGATYHPWIWTQINGGVINDRFGNPIKTLIVSGLWPGENDGSGGRRILRQTNVRFTLTVTTPFVASATLNAI